MKKLLLLAMLFVSSSLYAIDGSYICKDKAQDSEIRFEIKENKELENWELYSNTWGEVQYLGFLEQENEYVLKGAEVEVYFFKEGLTLFKQVGPYGERLITTKVFCTKVID